jgi:hypothetical protein
MWLMLGPLFIAYAVRHHLGQRFRAAVRGYTFSYGGLLLAIALIATVLAFSCRRQSAVCCCSYRSSRRWRARRIRAERLRLSRADALRHYHQLPGGNGIRRPMRPTWCSRERAGAYGVHPHLWRIPVGDISDALHAQGLRRDRPYLLDVSR